MKKADVNKAMLEDARVHPRIKLAGLWASTTFCYIYGDYFELYVPGKLSSMLDGKILPLGNVSEKVLFGTALMLAIPSVMIALSLIVSARLCRWLNLLFGVIFTLMMLAIAARGGWVFYRFFALVEVALTSSVVWHAWRWPRFPGANRDITFPAVSANPDKSGWLIDVRREMGYLVYNLPGGDIEKVAERLRQSGAHVRRSDGHYGYLESRRGLACAKVSFAAGSEYLHFSDIEDRHLHVGSGRSGLFTAILLWPIDRGHVREVEETLKSVGASPIVLQEDPNHPPETTRGI